MFIFQRDSWISVIAWLHPKLNSFVLSRDQFARTGKIVVKDTRWKRRVCRRRTGNHAVKNAGDYRDTRRRNEVSPFALARSPAITILSFFRPRMLISFRFPVAPARSASHYLMSPFPSFFQPSDDDHSASILIFFAQSADRYSCPSRFHVFHKIVNLRGLIR